MYKQKSPLMLLLLFLLLALPLSAAFAQETEPLPPECEETGECIIDLCEWEPMSCNPMPECPPDAADCGDPCEMSGEGDCPQPCDIAPESCVDPPCIDPETGMILDECEMPEAQHDFVEGVIAEVGDAVIVIEMGEDRIAIALNDETVVDGELTAGSWMFAEGVVQDDGTWTAIYVVAWSDEKIDPCVDPATGMMLDDCEPVDCPLDAADCGDPCDWAVDCDDPCNNYATGVMDPQCDYHPFEGYITEVGDGVVVVAMGDERFTFAITAETMIDGELAAESIIYVVAMMQEDGTWAAIYVAVWSDEQFDPCDDPMTGSIEECGIEYITVEGVIAEADDMVVVIEMNEDERLVFAITEETMIEGELTAGSNVYIEGMRQDGDTWVIKHVSAWSGEKPVDPYLYIDGVIEVLEEGALVINGTEVAITADTELFGELAEGAWAYVMAEAAGDGSLTALYIEGWLQIEGDPPPTGGVPDESDEAWNENWDDHAYFMGVIDEVGDAGMVVIDGETYALTNDSDVVGQLTAGSLVYVSLTEDGAIFYVEVIDETGDPIVESAPLPFQNQTLELLDTITSIEGLFVVVGGELMIILDESEVTGDLAVGNMAFVYGTRSSSSDPWSAVYVEVLDTMMIGEVEAINGDEMVVDGQTIQVDERVRMMGNISVGTNVAIAHNDADTAGNVFVQSLGANIPTAVTLSQSTATSSSAVLLLLVVAMLGTTVVAARKEL